MRDQKFSHTKIKGLFVQDCQILPKLVKKTLKLSKKLQKKKDKPIMVCTCSQIQRIYKSQTHYSCRVGLSWSIQKIEPNKMLERILTRNARKLKWVYDTVVMLVGTSNGCWNLGRKIKNSLFFCLDNDMIIWWSSRYYDDPLCRDHHGSSVSSVSKPWLQSKG